MPEGLLTVGPQALLSVCSTLSALGPVLSKNSENINKTVCIHFLGERMHEQGTGKIRLETLQISRVIIRFLY